MIYNDYELPFDRIFEDNKQNSIHQKNIESLAIEIYNIQASLTPPIMVDYLLPGKTIFLQGTSNMERDSGKIKGIGNTKKKKKRKCDACPCRICKTYIQRVGLLDKNCNVFSLGHHYSNTTYFSIFINKNFYHQESILLILVHFSDYMSYPCKYIL